VQQALFSSREHFPGSRFEQLSGLHAGCCLCFATFINEAELQPLWPTTCHRLFVQPKSILKNAATTAAWRCRLPLLTQVKEGEVAPEALEKAEKRLGQLDVQLQTLQSSYQKLKQQAGALLASIGSTGASNSSTDVSVVPDSAAATQSSPSTTDAAGTDSGSGSKNTAAVTAGVGALSGAMYAGLKFSSLAMRIAGDVVSSVKDDAGRMLKVRGQAAQALQLLQREMLDGIQGLQN